MRKKESKPATKAMAASDELVVLNRMARLLEVLAQLNLQAMKGDRSQGQMISMLDSVGCGQTEIARLLGTTTNTVNVALYKAKNKSSIKKKRK